MRAAAVRPTGVERSLSPDEFIVSKTDPKGVITYVNHVFSQMAAASEEELLGKPHSIIRHPDMPRAVFKYMWDTISARQEIFAYVKNLAFDGAHYWVFAHVTPTGRRDEAISGYHSNRRAPAGEAVATVEAVYRKLREIEQSHTSSQEGLEASVAALYSTLDDLGLTYDEFVWSITP